MIANLTDPIELRKKRRIIVSNILLRKIKRLVMKEVQMAYIVPQGRREKVGLMKRPELELNDVSEELYKSIFCLV